MVLKLFMTALLLQFTLVCLADAQSDSTVVDTNEKRNVIGKILKYFDESNKVKSTNKFDFSIIGGPHYSSDTKLGLGLTGAGLYRTAKNDTLLPQSNVSLYGDVSIVGFYMLGIQGTNIFPEDRYRLDYDLYFFSFPTKFWGIGYENGKNDENKTKYHLFQARIAADFLIKISSNFFAGPIASFDYVYAKSIENPDIWLGEDKNTTNFGLGVSLRYDTRDHLTNAYRGICLQLDQYFRPRFLGNQYAFSSTEFTAKYYKQLWKGGILASRLHGLFNYGNPPWGMMAQIGGSYSMRGYYEGRYRDKDEMDLTFELRQHIWRRNGAVVWVGAGTVFPKFSELRFNRILPNYGIGYRWEFKQRVNVRLDYGFGKKQNGFIFNVNEAF